MELLKIGELAQETDRLPSAIHFYTQEGLIKPDSYTRGGYRLYARNRAIKRIKLIEKLQFQKRWRIEEIKTYLSTQGHRNSGTGRISSARKNKSC